MKLVLVGLVALLGCNGATDPAVGGAGGGGVTSSTIVSSATHGSSVAVGATDATASSVSSTVASSSTGACVPIACPAGSCGDYPDGCGSTSPCSTVCAFGTECSASNACEPCQDAATCESCYPTAAQLKATCNAHPPQLQHNCDGPWIASTVQCVPPGSASYLVVCNWDDMGGEHCVPQGAPGSFCWDVYADQACPGFPVPPN